MTRLVIARLARGGKQICAGRSSLAGLVQVTPTWWLRGSVTASSAPSPAPTDVASSETGAGSVQSASRVSSCVISVSADPPRQRSSVRFVPPSARLAATPLRAILRPCRSLIVGGILEPAACRAGSDCLIPREGGGRHTEL
jgi:hypothetical protein